MKWNINGVTKENDELTAEDVEYIVISSWYSAEYLSHHPLLTQAHIDYIVEVDPELAVEYLKHRLSKENLEWLATKYPDLYEDLYK